MQKVTTAQLEDFIEEGFSDIEIAKHLNMAVSNIRKRCAPLRENKVNIITSQNEYILLPDFYIENKGKVYFRGDYTAREILAEAEAKRA